MHIETIACCLLCRDDVHFDAVVVITQTHVCLQTCAQDHNFCNMVPFAIYEYHIALRLTCQHRALACLDRGRAYCLRWNRGPVYPRATIEGLSFLARSAAISHIACETSQHDGEFAKGIVLMGEGKSIP